MVARIIAAFALDAAAGEPPEALHPVRWMGKLVEVFDRSLPGRRRAPVARAAGAAVALTLPVGVYLAARGLIKTLPRPLSGAAEVVLLWVSLSARSLSDGGRAVGAALDGGGDADGGGGIDGGGIYAAGGIEGGRSAVSRLVGRDTSGLDEKEVIRAAVESVAENANDGVVAPLFYGFVGGAPLALAYKMVNTLDSMIGYRNSRYADFGWAAAWLDDAAGYLPARLTAAAVVAASPAVGGSAAASWRVWRREAGAHDSPNAGVCEGAFAGSLKVRLGGDNTYGGRVVRKAVLGRDFEPPGRGDIARAADLMYGASLLFLGATAACRWAWDRSGRAS